MQGVQTNRQSIDPKYATTVTVRGGREGHAISDDGVLDVQLRRPRSNGVSDGTNTEQLFAAWGGCYQSALTAVARGTGDDVSKSVVIVQIAQGPDAECGYGLAERFSVEIPGMDDARVQQLADAAHELCPYTRATRGNIEVETVVVHSGLFTRPPGAAPAGGLSPLQGASSVERGGFSPAHGRTALTLLLAFAHLEATETAGRPTKRPTPAHPARSSPVTTFPETRSRPSEA
jgi:Ohr subfamily peroxiredoxin